MDARWHKVKSLKTTVTNKVITVIKYGN
jgi:hypothetical protein